MDTYTVANYVHIAFVAFVAVWTLVGAIKGAERGISRQIVRVATVAVSLVATLIIVKVLYTQMHTFIDGKTMMQIVTELGLEQQLGEYTELINSIDAESAEYVALLPITLIVMPVAFSTVFWVINQIIRIVYVIVCGIAGLKKRNNNFLTRTLGFAVGALQGFIVSAILLMPIIGTVNTATAALSVAKQTHPDDENVTQLAAMYDEYLNDIVTDNVFNIMSNCGADALYSYCTTAILDDGTKLNMRDNTSAIAEIAIEIMSFKGDDMTHLTEDNKESLNSIAATASENDYVSTVVCALLRTIPTLYDSGYISVEAEEPLASVLDATIQIFGTAAPENLHEDMTTLLNVYYLFSDYALFDAFAEGEDATLSALTTLHGGKTIVTMMVEELNSNERTQPLITVITQLTVGLMCDNLGLTDDVKQTYENIKTGVNETLQINKSDYETSEEYVDAVSQSLSAVLENEGLEVEDDVIYAMAEYISDNELAAEYGELTDAEINEVIISYYDAYLASLETDSSAE